MRYIKKFNESLDESRIVSICEKYKIKNYTIDENGLVNVKGDVSLYNKRLTELPLKFGEITGSFNCRYNKLTSLEGFPTKIGDGFHCGGNKLTSLKGCPEIVGEFHCENNQLTSLTDCPKNITF